MITAILTAGAPVLPPQHFEVDPPAIYRDAWATTPGEPLSIFFGRGFSNTFSSSMIDGSLEKFLEGLRLPGATSSNVNVSEFGFRILSAQKRAADVNPARASENIYELRRLTSLGWGKLSELLGVDRRTIHNWVKGSEIREKNAERIAKVLSVLRYIDCGTGRKNAEALGRADSSGRTAFDLLVAGQFDDVRQMIGAGKSRADLSAGMSSKDWSERLPSYNMHPDASPEDVADSLEMEPEPRSRSRVVQRS